MIGTFDDAQLDDYLRQYLAWRAERVAVRSRGSEATAEALGRKLDMLAPPLSSTRSVVRLALAVVLLLLALLAAAVVGSIFRERYAPSVPLLQVPLAGDPWPVAATSRSIWVGALKEPLLYRLEPRDGTVIDTIPVVAPICGTIESGYGALWFSHCGVNILSRLDLTTLEIDRLVGHATDRVGLGADSVWTSRTTNVVRLDPSTLESEAEIAVGASSLLTFGEGSAWAMTTDASKINRIDPQTNEVIATIPLPSGSWGNGFPVHGVIAAGALWVIDDRALQLYRIDAATYEVRPMLELQPFHGTGFGDWYITTGAGLLWVRYSIDEIVAVDPANGRIVDRVATAQGAGGGFVITDDSLWVGNSLEGTIWGYQLP